MSKYYAVCNANGPISVRLRATKESDAVKEFSAADSRAWIDAARTDVEDELDIDGEGMTEQEFDEALEDAGCAPVKDLDSVFNAHAGTSAHLKDGWYLWAKHDPRDYIDEDGDCIECGHPANGSSGSGSCDSPAHG